MTPELKSAIEGAAGDEAPVGRERDAHDLLLVPGHARERLVAHERVPQEQRAVVRARHEALAVHPLVWHLLFHKLVIPFLCFFNRCSWGWGR